MVRQDKQEIALLQGALDLRQPGIKLLQALGIGFHVIAVAPEHVEIHQVHKDQAVLLFGREEFH